MSGGGGSGSDGGGDMEVSGAEAAYSQEKGISTHADTRVSQTSFSPGGEGQGQAVDRGGVHDTGPVLGPDTSTQGIALAEPYSESEIEKGVTKEGITIDETVERPGKREGQTDTSYDVEKGFLQQEFDDEGPVTDDKGNPVLVEGRNIRDPETGEPITPDEFSVEQRAQFIAKYGLAAWNAFKGSLSGVASAFLSPFTWLANQDWGSSTSNIVPAPDRGNGNGGGGLLTSNSAVTQSSTGGVQPSTTSSPAALWYANLGSGVGTAGFNLDTAYANAKSQIGQKLNTSSQIGWTAVSADSPFYNFLKDNSLNKGIL